MSYRVVEFTGGLINEGERAAWVTDFHVVDERGRTVAVYPHSQHGSGVGWVRNRRRKARLHAARLNEAPAYVPPSRQDQASYSFRPTCPRCMVVCPVGARYCNECGAFLYLTDAELAELGTPTRSSPGCEPTPRTPGLPDSSPPSTAHSRPPGNTRLPSARRAP